MAKPRVFVSSTYYDLKHLRSSLENFIEGLGYEAVLSEKDSIPYVPEVALDESCYREARNSDVFVLIIGGRYGSAASSERNRGVNKSDFYATYESITKEEYKNARSKGIPTYICIEASVDAEYQTYLKNKGKKGFKYAHVDSENIFRFIESIRNEPRNNPIKLFTRYSEIESWLKEQWAGYFRELIGKQSHAKEIVDIGKRIGDLAATTETLKRYLEEVISRVTPQKADPDKLIREENSRLKKALMDSEFTSIGYIRHLKTTHSIEFEKIRRALNESSTYPKFFSNLLGKKAFPSCAASLHAFEEINEARKYLDLPEYSKTDYNTLKAIADKVTKPKLPLKSKTNSKAE